MDALIFDFDGVVVDSEPVHYEGFRTVLHSRGIELTRQDYYAKYLGFDDHDCFEAIFREHRVEVTENDIAGMIADKTVLVQDTFARSIKPLSGSVELISQGEQAGIPIGVCSGALRKEIELAAQAVGVLKHFNIIVSAEDVTRGKPDPQGYRLAIQRLSHFTGRALRAGRTVVLEDSPAGIEAAKSLGMKVLAVATSYDRSALVQADRTVGTLVEVAVADLRRLL